MLRLHPAGYAQHERTSKPARPERSEAKSKGEQGVFTTHLKKDPYIKKMARFILRYKGSGSKPQEDVARIRALAHTTVLDESDRMLLVAAPEAELRALMGSLPDWVMSAEKTLTLPDPRPRILRGPNKNR